MEAPRCTYTSKPCNEPRAVKENGELHRLCDLHRINANAAQRRWHARQQIVLRERLGAMAMGTNRRGRQASAETSRPVASPAASISECRRHSETQELDIVEMTTRGPLAPLPINTLPPPTSFRSSQPEPSLACNPLPAEILTLLDEIFLDVDASEGTDIKRETDGV